MPTKPRRHKTVKINCKNCGVEFDTLVQRQKRGQGNFCTLKCYRDYYDAHPVTYKYTGKENACVFFDEKRNCRLVYWYDEGTRKRHNSTHAKWWWELNRGDVPEGYVVTGRDDETYALELRMAVSSKYGKLLVGRAFSDETREKMSASGKNKVFSDEQKRNMSSALMRNWGKGIYDSVHIGENSSKWRGGKSFELYPKEFSRSLKEFIKDRDNHQCQVCSRDVYRSKHGHIHHMDGDKKNNDSDNLILLCSSCHEKIHAGGQLSPALQAFRDKLYE